MSRQVFFSAATPFRAEGDGSGITGDVCERPCPAELITSSINDRHQCIAVGKILITSWLALAGLGVE